MSADAPSNLKDPQEYLLALCAIKGMTSHIIARQAQRHGGLDALVRGDLLRYSRYDADTRRLLRMALRSGLEPELEKAREEIDSARAVGANLITVLEDSYPVNLRLIYNLPPFLFSQGSITAEDTMSVAVIGARDASSDGLCDAKRLASELAKAGLTVVSGLSLGIDTVAHEAALEEEGRTIAVITSGILQCYPPENGPLAERITHSGAVVSRFWPTQAPTRYTFPNRAVVTSGIAQGTLVIEGSCPSAAQGQARQTLEHGKQLFLLDRLVRSEPWAQDYLQRGAIEVESAEDILKHMQSVSYVEKLTGSRETKPRVRVPYFKPTPIAWGTTKTETAEHSTDEPGWPSGSPPDHTPSSWPSGTSSEDERATPEDDSDTEAPKPTLSSAWPTAGEVEEDTADPEVDLDRSLSSFWPIAGQPEDDTADPEDDPDRSLSSCWPSGEEPEDDMADAEDDPELSAFNRTPSSSWPLGGASEDDTTASEPASPSAKRPVSIGKSTFAHIEEDPEADIARCVGAACSFQSGIRAGRSDDTLQESEVEMIFEPQYDGGYTVYAPELPGLVTKGETLEQATVSATEALELYAKNMRDHGKPIRQNVLRRKFRVPV